MIYPHQRCLNSLITDVYKCLNGFFPDIWYTCSFKKWCNTWHYNLFVTDRPKTDRYGRNSIQYRAIRYATYCPVKWKDPVIFYFF